MRLFRPQGPTYRRSLRGLVPLLLALVALVELQLLLRPWSSCVDGKGSVADSLFGEEQRRSPQSGANAALGAVRNAHLAFITFGNAAFAPFVTNWVLSVQRLGLPFLVGALDAGMVEMCRKHGWAHLDVSALVRGNSSFFRADFRTFRSMGATKVQLVLTMLEEMQLGMVMVSDSDTTWLGDPSSYLGLHRTADFYISTDCLSHQVEVDWKPAHFQPRCGHIPGNSWGRAFNTGVFAVRNSPAGRLLLARWRDKLLDPDRATVVTATNATLGITDQLALNMVLDATFAGRPAVAAPEDERVLLMSWAPNDTLRLHPLPVARFSSGHVAFVQRLPWRHGIDPFVVHATFQRYAVAMHQAGKRARFRELGMWFLDGPEYYDPPGARYLTYTHDVRRVVEELAVERFGGAMAPLYKQYVAVNYQIALFRDALAMARLLNRTLVLPASWCWCDYDWTPHVVERCKIRGSDLRLPFECPADFVFHIPHMEAAGVDYRMPGFLQLPQVPESVRRWQAQVPMLPARPPRLAAQAAVNGGIDAQPGKPTSALWPRMRQRDVLEALAPLQDAPAITLTNLRPGALEGFATAVDGRAFDLLFANATQELYWCCYAQSRTAAWNGIAYQLPPPFSRGYTEWVAPEFPMPTYCDQVDKATAEFTAWPNHPCQFMRNATAAAIAGQFT